VLGVVGNQWLLAGTSKGFVFFSWGVLTVSNIEKILLLAAVCHKPQIKISLFIFVKVLNFDKGVGGVGLFFIFENHLAF